MIEERIKTAVLAPAGFTYRIMPPEADAITYVSRVKILILMPGGRHDYSAGSIVTSVRSTPQIRRSSAVSAGFAVSASVVVGRGASARCVRPAAKKPTNQA